MARAELERRGVISLKRDFEVEPQIQHGTTTLPLHKGQLRAWSSVKRIVAVFAGWQSGKTVIGPHWLRREMARRGPGDYAVIAPNYPLLDNKARPELLKVFGPMLHKSGNELIVTPYGCKQLGWPAGSQGRILLRHAERAEAIEAFTALGIWVDEPGQIADEVWEAIQARGAVNQARFLLTSRPYEHNWYVRDIWHSRGRDDIEVVNFKSIENPMFPVEEYETQKNLLPEWKFTMKYDGVPTRPAGLVYDCFDDANVVRAEDVLPEGKIPRHWQLYIGVDFGNLNTAAVVVAEETKRDWLGHWTTEPTGNYYLVASYHAGEQRTSKEHLTSVRQICDALVEGGQSEKPIAVGGAHGEDGWREAWGLSGLGIAEPVTNKVDTQVSHVYAAFKTKKLRVLDTCEKVLEEIRTFSYELDDDGEPTQKFLNEAKYHRLAGLRYLATRIFRGIEMDRPPKIRASVARE